jgi:acetyl esterase/lipase
LDDARNAYLWLRRHAPETGRVILVGDSSGAGLALSLLLTLRSQDEPLPAATVLQCPALFLAPHPKREQGAASVRTGDPAQQLAALYLGDHPAEDPIVDPLHGDLHGLPPMLIQAATGDRRLPDATELAAHARDDGVDVHLDLYPVDAHGFHLFWSFLPEAAAAIERAGAFIRQAVSAAAQAGVRAPRSASK